jgi:hypothetical protein
MKVPRTSQIKMIIAKPYKNQKAWYQTARRLAKKQERKENYAIEVISIFLVPSTAIFPNKSKKFPLHSS